MSDRRLAQDADDATRGGVKLRPVTPRPAAALTGPDQMMSWEDHVARAEPEMSAQTFPGRRMRFRRRETR